MTQFLTHTPIYVWGILALLLYRGAVAMREREVPVSALFIIPVVMLALSLHDIGTRFGPSGFAPVLWALGALAAALLAFSVGESRVIAASRSGRVRIQGSPLPLAMMLAVFAIKYAASAALAIQPRLGQDALFVAAVCVAYGACNGCFLGRLAGDLRAWRATALA